MLDEQVPENIKRELGRSIVIVERHRASVTEKLKERLAAFERAGDDFVRSEVTGTMLTDLLFEEARHIVATGRAGRLAAVVREHLRLGIGGVDYSRYGSELGPVLREVLGPGVTPNIISAWVDAYWFTIRQLAATGSVSKPPPHPKHGLATKTSSARSWR